MQASGGSALRRAWRVVLLMGNDDAARPRLDCVGVESRPRLQIRVLREQFHGVVAVFGRLREALEQPLRCVGGDEGVNGVMAVVVAPLRKPPSRPEFGGQPPRDCADAEFALLTVFALLVVEIREVAAGGSGEVGRFVEVPVEEVALLFKGLPRVFAESPLLVVGQRVGAFEDGVVVVFRLFV